MRVQSFMIPLFALFVCGFAAGVEAETFTVINTDDSGPGSLRQAIEDAKAADHAWADEIVFAIPGDGPHTIQLQSPLVIGGNLHIDATTQSGTNCPEHKTMIEIDASQVHNGLYFHPDGVDDDNVWVKGLTINRAIGAGVVINQANYEFFQITCSNIGTDPSGETALPNGLGISVEQSRFPDNLINISRSVISGNNTAGILVFNSSGLLVTDNIIGKNAAGAPLGNVQTGIFVWGNDAQDNAFLNNTIAFNEGLGIDLLGNGPTGNDPSDSDPGPNGLINYPEILTVNRELINGTPRVRVTYKLDVGPVNGDRYEISFYGNTDATADLTGYGEGGFFIGGDEVENRGPDFIHEVILADINLPMISATTTRLTGDEGYYGSTSEFSPNKIFKIKDYGDAPVEGEDAWHIINSNLYMGHCVDGDAGSYQNQAASGDDQDIGELPAGMECETQGDDEDGLVYITGMSPGGRTKMEVVVSDLGYLNVWIDFNHDGDWTDEGEHVVTDRFYSQGGQYESKFDVPEHAVLGETYMRIRYSYEPGLQSTGGVGSGEVEDYRVKVEEGGGHFDPVTKRTQPEPWTPVKTETKGTSIKR